MSPLRLYLLLAFGISWTVAGIAFLAGIAYDGPLGLFIGALFMMGPALAAIWVRLRMERLPLTPLGLSLRDTNWRWMAVTAVLGLSFAPLTLLYSHLLGDVLQWEGFGRTAVNNEMLLRNMTAMMKDRGLPDSEGLVHTMLDKGITAPFLLVIMLVSGLFAALTVNIPFMFGEEFGWRGFMHHHARHWPFGRLVLITGIVWGIWHAPIIVQGHNYPGHPLLGVVMMTLFTTVLSLPFAWVRIRTRSVWGPVLLHGIINGTAGASLLFTEDAHVLLGSIAGVPGLLAIGTATLLMIVLDPGKRVGTGPIEC